MTTEVCHHMREAIPTGACYICQPAMFPSREAVAEYEWFFRLWREAQETDSRFLYQPSINGAPHQSQHPAPEPPLSAATPPDDTGLAAWQELTRNELVMLDTLVALARNNAGFEGVGIDELYESFVEAAAAMGVTSWTEAEVNTALAGLQGLGWAGYYADSGAWAAGGKGIAIIEDYRRRSGRAAL